MLKEYDLNYDKRRTNQGMQTNLALREESNADWLNRKAELAAAEQQYQEQVLAGDERIPARVNSKVFTVHQPCPT